VAVLPDIQLRRVKAIEVQQLAQGFDIPLIEPVSPNVCEGLSQKIKIPLEICRKTITRTSVAAGVKPILHGKNPGRPRLRSFRIDPPVPHGFIE
jgi:hypothetical protein